MGSGAVREVRPEVADQLSVGAMVARVTAQLRPSLGGAAEREARDLITAVMERPRSWASTAAAAPIDATNAGRILAATERRAAGAPLAYAVGNAPFRHLLLMVDERVLIPRPETEGIVQALLRRNRRPDPLVLDVGTGSGCLA
ncbi:MAG TPA: hypothetical protein VFV33_19785, partial [Gemmatimonadaceae bacterium]|nr:hypothetical protein [Gemmatimonadaceae bacterium]